MCGHKHARSDGGHHRATEGAAERQATTSAGVVAIASSMERLKPSIQVLWQHCRLR